MSRGEELRDAGIEQVTESNAEWVAVGLDIIAAEPPGIKYTGEELHQLVTAQLGEPHSPNATGALVMHAKRLKLIRWNGKISPMRKPSSHARKTPEYITR